MDRLKRKNVDMLNGPILKRIVTFGLPIFLGSVFQQLYSMVDSIVVGQYNGANALAAVSSTSTLSMLVVGLMVGFPAGASIVTAQFMGAGLKDKIKSSIATTMWFLLALAAFITVAGLACSNLIMNLMNVPEEIFADSVAYFRIYLVGMVFMALYNFYAAFLRAMGDSTTPLLFLILSSLLNIGGDLFFVIVLDMGVVGVGWATVMAQAISVALCFVYTRRTNEYFRLSRADMKFDGDLFKSILRLGLPSSIQSSVVGLGMVMVQSLINSFGAVNIAAYGAANRMEQLCNLPIGGISMSLSLFVGQNIGAKNEKRAMRGLYESTILCMALSAVLSIVIIIFGRNIMTLFVKESDKEVIEVGAKFMKLWAPLVFTHGLFQCIVSFLRGAGDSIHSMIAMFFDLITRTIMAYIFACSWGFNLGFMGIAYSIPCGWIACSIYSMIRYFQGGWRKKAVVK